MTANTYILIISIALAIVTYNYFNKRAAPAPPRTTLQNVLKFVKYFFVMSAYSIVLNSGYSFAVVGLSQATNNTAGQLSQNDTTVMADFKGYTRAWNQTTGKIVREYLDTSISADDWVSEMNTDLPALRGLYLKMTIVLALIDDKNIKNMYSRLVENYKEKLDGLTNLHVATAQGNAQGEKDALIEMQNAAQKGQVIGLEYLAKHKKEIDPETLREMAKETAGASVKALQPAQAVTGEPLEIKCKEPLPSFTLGRESRPSEEQITALCSCMWNDLNDWEKRASQAAEENKFSEVPILERTAFPASFRRAVKNCGGMEL